MDGYSRAAGRTDAGQRTWLKTHGKGPMQVFLNESTGLFDNLIRDPASEQEVIDYAQFTAT